MNLLPTDGKLCNFNCCYCECGWTLSGLALRFNDKDQVIALLEDKLREMLGSGSAPDVITFAGNGEPTMHPHFAEIITKTIALRDEICPKAKVAVLSNATMLHREDVREALAKVDRAMLKIDSVIDNSIKLINDPRFSYSLESVVDSMKLYKGELIIQTMMLRGDLPEGHIDNTTQEETMGYLSLIEELGPKLVMLYTIDRDTPADHLEQVSNSDMHARAEKIRALGIECSVAEIKDKK